MQNGSLAGLIKFFSNEEYLDSLINGLFYCNTPEHYRLSGQEGIGDYHESCRHAYRISRGDEPVKLYVGGKELEGITALTLHNSSSIKDKWLHCWFVLSIPDDEHDLESLVKDINRMRYEFGNQYAFIQPNYIKQFGERLKTLTKHKVEHGPVSYSDKPENWFIGCKASSYAYQREFRFVVGECSHTSVKPLKIQDPNGFSDLILKNPSIQFTDSEDDYIWFHLDIRKCYYNTERIKTGNPPPTE